MSALIPLVLFGAVAGPFFLVTLLRKRCPSCGRRSGSSAARSTRIHVLAPSPLGGDGRGLSAPESPAPRAHKRYVCAACRKRFASPSPGIVIAQDDWDQGVRTAVPTARVIKD